LFITLTMTSCSLKPIGLRQGRCEDRRTVSTFC
jgi:hypothetical protein